MNLHVLPRSIYFSRHGQSEYNVQGKIGGDSSLSPAGLAYARALSEWTETLTARPDHKHLRLWTSSLKRTIETSQFIRHTRDEECVCLLACFSRLLVCLSAAFFVGGHTDNSSNSLSLKPQGLGAP